MGNSSGSDEKFIRENLRRLLTIKDPKERQKHFGQYDHVRWYGMDYFDRLRKAGFEVEQNFYSQTFSEEEIKKFGLRHNEILPVVYKK